MSLLDAILNCVALLLWLNWRSIDLSPTLRASSGSLLSTLKRIEVRQERTWIYLAALLLLLAVRPPIYQRLGEASQWAPTLDLGIVHLTFRAQDLGKVYLCSTLGFLKVCGVFYWCLIFLCAIHRKLPDTVTYQRFVRLHLGPMARVPSAIILLAVPLAVLLLWVSLQRPMSSLDLVPSATSNIQSLRQGAALALSSYLALAIPLCWVFGLHLVNSYVYLGNHDFWNYIHATARRCLSPFRFIPLTISKVDLAPVLGLAACAAIDVYGTDLLTLLYSKNW